MNKNKVTDYKIEICYSDRDNSFVAKIPELPYTSSHGKTEQEALKNVLKAGQLWLDSAYAEGTLVPEPISKKEYSGKLVIRIPVEVHRELAFKAQENSVSLNQYILSKLA